MTDEETIETIIENLEIFLERSTLNDVVSLHMARIEFIKLLDLLKRRLDVD